MLNQTEKNGVMKKILIVYISNHLVDSVYRELADYFNKYGINCELCSCSVGSEESLVEHISGYIREHDVSLVLLGSRLFQLINGRLQIPLVEIRRSFYDFYVSIKNSTRPNRMTAMVYWGPLKPLELEYWKELKDYVRLCLIDPEPGEGTRERELKTRQAIRQLKSEGYKRIVGVGMVYDITLEEGLEAEFISFSKANLLQSVHEVLHHARMFEQDQENLKSLRTIFRELDEGIIVTNDKGEIYEINDAARQIFKGIPHIDKRNIKELFPLEAVSGAMEQNRELSRLVCSVEKKTLMLNLHISHSGRLPRYNFIFYPSAVVRAMEREIQLDIRKKGYIAKNTFHDIQSSGACMDDLKKKAARYAAVESTVILYGESGTGKELFAQSIHNESPRRNYPFVAINCGALPENLLESELFGYVKGAFTGAKAEGKAGIFELAHRGTLFLDEIGELPLQMQVRLLRVLQEKEIVRIGDDRVTSVDVRIIAATNRNLYSQVLEGKFREDLYYRLNVLTLRIPPVRERKEDLPALLNFFLRQSGEGGKILEPDAMRECESYSWPGNVREIRNFVERLSLLSELSDRNRIDRRTVREALEIELEGISMAVSKPAAARPVVSEPAVSEPAAFVPAFSDRTYISDTKIRLTLERNHGNRKKTAGELGISTTTLWRRLRAMDETV